MEGADAVVRPRRQTSSSDLDAGTLTVYKTDQRLGVMTTGHAGRVLLRGVQSRRLDAHRAGRASRRRACCRRRHCERMNERAVCSRAVY
jgi:hypothetical protein